jgi:glycogen debranching enzyme
MTAQHDQAAPFQLFDALDDDTYTALKASIRERGVQIPIVLDEDGTIFDFTRPYAPVAAQGYAYDALLGAAELLDGPTGPPPVEPTRLRSRAAALRARVLDAFWLPELRTFAHAVTIGDDGRLRPARVVASAAGHLLASRLLDGADAAPP